MTTEVKYPTAELARLEDNRLFSKATLQAARDNVELNLIFNAHGSVEDAEATLAHIPPFSFVLVEGFGGMELEETTRQAYAINFSHLQMHGDESHDFYISKKGAMVKSLLEGVEQVEEYQAADNEVHHFDKRLYRYLAGLIEKDCIIFRADAPNLQTLLSGFDQFGQFNIVPGFPNGYRYTQQALANGNSSDLLKRHIAKRLALAAAGHTKESAFHYIRESVALGVTDNIALQLLTSPPTLPHIHRGQKKIPLYMTYGTAHGKSLAHKAVNAGYKPNVLYVDDIIDDHEYLDLELSRMSPAKAYAALGAAAFSRIVNDIYPENQSMQELAKLAGSLGTLDTAISGQLVRVHDEIEAAYLRDDESQWLTNDQQYRLVLTVYEAARLIAQANGLKQIAHSEFRLTPIEL